MSGSFKKLTKANQKVHRERSQPSHRAHLGPLEKKKDYVRRAREHHKKRDKIKELRRKAAERNPDEFYFSMVSSEKVDGVHQAKAKSETTDAEQEMLMRGQDLRYVIMKITTEKKKIERLKGEMTLLDQQFRENSHIIFVEDKKDVAKAKRRVENQKMEMSLNPEQEKEMEKKYSLLAKRCERLKELETVREKLEVSLHLTKDKTSKKKMVKEETKESAAVYRWCFKRKR